MKLMPPERRIAVETAIREGKTYTETHKLTGVSHNGYKYAVKRLGLTVRKGSASDPERDKAVFDYTLAHTLEETAKHFSISRSTVCACQRRHYGRGN